MCIVHSNDLDGASELACAQAGCRECQDRLVRQHTGLVHYVLRHHVRGQVAYAELLQAGRIGLWQAVLHFDPERRVAFSTYAVVAIQRRMWQVVAEANRWVGAYPAPEAVQVKEVAEEAVWLSQVGQALNEAVFRLPERLRQIMVAAYGLDGQSPRSLAALGRQFSVSREAVRQWRNEALVLLRLPVVCGDLRQVYGQDGRGAYARSQALSRAWQRQRRGRAR